MKRQIRRSHLVPGTDQVVQSVCKVIFVDIDDDDDNNNNGDDDNIDEVHLLDPLPS